MKKVQINCNTKGEVDIDDNARANGISIALVDENQVPVARYHFAKIENIEKIAYFYDSRKRKERSFYVKGFFFSYCII